MSRLSQQRSFLSSSVFVAILIERMFSGSVFILVMGLGLTIWKATWLSAKCIFALLLGDLMYGRLPLSMLGAHFLPEMTELNRGSLLLLYIGAAALPAIGLYIFNTSYAVMFVGQEMWQKPIFYQAVAHIAVGIAWSTYAARFFKNNAPATQSTP